jgi:hypothetical protein
MSKQPVRLITVAWGERYIEELFSLTLPALLAPNNLPALAENFACELVIVTPEGSFDRLRQHPVYFQLRRYCIVEFRPIDDLVNQPDAYGMTLTYALFRGFEELGPAMLDRQLIFFNADFILADGSLRTVGEKILAGERLILSPSYCVVGEAVTPWLMSRKDADTGVLAVSSREMAATALRHRHNTIRGKTVNQRAFSVEWMDQFYWLVDEHTLIGHQMPFAVVSMRPERVLTDMCTFWDYGIISEACPTTPRCVIGDSDAFLMIELRSADTARDQLSLGWPEPKQIAEKLTQFITKDPIELARYTLVLHSADLPPGVDEAKARLDWFVDDVLAELPREPTPWVNHPIWAYHYPYFHQARRAFLNGEPAQPHLNEVAPASEEPLAGARPSRGLVGVARRLYHRCFGHAPWFRTLHPRWRDVQPVLRVLREQPEADTLVVSSALLPERLFGTLPARHISVPALVGPGGRPPERSVAEPRSLIETGAQGFLLHAREPARQGAAAEPDGAVSAVPVDTYGLGIFELSGPDLSYISELLVRVSPWMRPGSKILVYHSNIGGRQSARDVLGCDRLWLDTPYEVHLVGSEAAFRLVDGFNRGIAGLRSRRLLPAAKGLMRIGRASISSLRANRKEPAPAQRRTGCFTSLTIEIGASRPNGTFAERQGALHAAE